MAKIELKLNDEENNKVEKGDFVVLKPGGGKDKVFVLIKKANIRDGEGFLLINIDTGGYWNSFGRTEGEVLDLIEEYDGRLIKNNKMSITFEEI